MKWFGLVAVLAVVSLAAYSFRSRQENLACQHTVHVGAHAPSCHKYTYWWDR